MTPTSPLPRFIETTTGPFSVEYLGHADAQAFDLNAGVTGACVETADLMICWRETHPKFHRLFIPILEELSGVSRQENKKATKAKLAGIKPENRDKATPVMESFNTFANRAKALVLKRDSGQTLWEQIEERALAMSKTLAIDATPTIRLSPIVKGDLSIAEQWLAAGDLDFVEDRITKFSNYLDGYDVERDDENIPMADSLSRLITKYKEKKLLNDD